LEKEWSTLDICRFKDLNDACPKNDFPLPITELLLDATTVFWSSVLHGWLLRIQSNQNAPQR